MDCVSSAHQLWIPSEEGGNSLLHTTETVTFLASDALRSSLEALRLIKRSSALAMLAGEVTVPHLETNGAKHSVGKSRRNHTLPPDGSPRQKVAGNEGREEKSGDETWSDHGMGGGE